VPALSIAPVPRRVRPQSRVRLPAPAVSPPPRTDASALRSPRRASPSTPSPAARRTCPRSMPPRLRLTPHDPLAWQPPAVAAARAPRPSRVRRDCSDAHGSAMRGRSRGLRLTRARVAASRSHGRPAPRHAAAAAGLRGRPPRCCSAVRLACVCVRAEPSQIVDMCCEQTIRDGVEDGSPTSMTLVARPRRGRCVLKGS